MRHLLHTLVALSSVAPALAAAAPYSVVLLGDSITQGQTSEPSGPPFAALLADSLGAGFDVINIGCGGASSRDWSPSAGDSTCGGLPNPLLLAPLYPSLAKPNLPADLVVVMLGTNDAIGLFEPAPLTSEEYRAALEELAMGLLHDGAGRVLLATPPPDFVVPYTEFTLIAYAGQVLDLCGAPGDAILCGPDVFNLLQFEDFASGDIHPNGAGHAKIADAMYSSILLAIPEPGTGAMLGLALLLLGRMRRSTPPRALRVVSPA